MSQDRGGVSELDEAVRRVAAGDPAAFHAIVHATAPRLFRLACRIMGQPEEAEDVLQDGYFRAFQALRSGRFRQGARVETWLYRIITNTAISALRSRRRARARDGEARQELRASGHVGEARLALAELSSWLAGLPIDQRTALVLKELEGLTVAEVAEVMERSEGAVEQYLVRARAALRAKRDHD